MEKRLLLAFVVSAVIFAVWSVLFPPERPTPPTAPTPALEQPATAAESPGAIDEGPEPTAAAPAEEADVPQEAIAGQSARVVRFENDVMVVEAGPALASHAGPGAVAVVVVKALEQEDGLEPPS